MSGLCPQGPPAGPRLDRGANRRDILTGRFDDAARARREAGFAPANGPTLLAPTIAGVHRRPRSGRPRAAGSGGTVPEPRNPPKSHVWPGGRRGRPPGTAETTGTKPSPARRQVARPPRFPRPDVRNTGCPVRGTGLKSIKFHSCHRNKFITSWIRLPTAAVAPGLVPAKNRAANRRHHNGGGGSVQLPGRWAGRSTREVCCMGRMGAVMVTCESRATWLKRQRFFCRLPHDVQWVTRILKDQRS